MTTAMKKNLQKQSKRNHCGVRDRNAKCKNRAKYDKRADNAKSAEHDNNINHFKHAGIHRSQGTTKAQSAAKNTLIRYKKRSN